MLKKRVKSDTASHEELKKAAKTQRVVTAMPVQVIYRATVAGYTFRQQDGESFFTFTRRQTDAVGHAAGDSINERWEDKYLDAYEVRAAFEEVESPEAALGFLARTGRFLPWEDGFTWTDFLKWKRFARLVREHELLAAAVRDGATTGEAAEVLKAIGGTYDSSFFEESTSVPADDELNKYPGALAQIKEAERRQRDEVKELCQWFRNPPSKEYFGVRRSGISIGLFPKDADDSLREKINQTGVMTDFLVPRESLQLTLVINADFTMQAIAATIYADRIAGVDYRKCTVCREERLFEVNKSRSWQTYCSPKCKQTAHQRRFRANQPSKATQPEQAKHKAKKKGRQ